MRRRLIGLVLFCVGCVAQKPVPVPIPAPLRDWTLTANWQYDFTNFATCSTTVTAGCVTGFTWGYLKGTTQVPLKTSLLPFTPCAVAPAVQVPPCVDTTTTPLTFHDTASGVVGIGPVTPYVVANGLDNNGVAVSSTPDLAAVDNVTIGSATNAGWKRQ
jgi:hypothetical protein